MRVTWNRPDTGEDVELIYLEDTYREQIAPRTDGVWTGAELLERIAAEDPPCS